MAYIAEERETVVNFTDLEELATVYTCNGVLMRRLEKLSEEHPEIYVKIGEDPTNSVTYAFPKELITFRAPRKASKREMTEQQKEAFVERMAKAREERLNGSDN